MSPPDAFPSLANLQQGFRANALDAPPASLIEAIRPAGVPAERRLAIHANHFATTLVEAVGGVFEATRALIGAEYFGGAALRFARARPPASPCLFEYGGAFPDYLAEAPGMADHAYVIEIARLEWLMHESFHAPAAPPLNPTRLTAVPGDALAGVRLQPHPTLRLFAASFPAAEVWRGARDGELDASVLEGGPRRLLLIRPDLDVEMEPVSDGLYWMLEAISGGASLGAAAECAAADAAFDFAEALGACLGRGFFADTLTT